MRRSGCVAAADVVSRSTHTVSLARSLSAKFQSTVALLVWPVRRVARCPFVAVNWHSRSLVTLSRLSLLPTQLVVATNITEIITTLFWSDCSLSASPILSPSSDASRIEQQSPEPERASK